MVSNQVLKKQILCIITPILNNYSLNISSDINKNIYNLEEKLNEFENKTNNRLNNLVSNCQDDKIEILNKINNLINDYKDDNNEILNKINNLINDYKDDNNEILNKIDNINKFIIDLYEKIDKCENDSIDSDHETEDETEEICDNLKLKNGCYNLVWKIKPSTWLDYKYKLIVTNNGDNLQFKSNLMNENFIYTNDCYQDCWDSNSKIYFISIIDNKFEVKLKMYNNEIADGMLILDNNNIEPKFDYELFLENKKNGL